MNAKELTPARLVNVNNFSKKGTEIGSCMSIFSLICCTKTTKGASSYGNSANVQVQTIIAASCKTLIPNQRAKVEEWTCRYRGIYSYALHRIDDTLGILSGGGFD